MTASRRLFDYQPWTLDYVILLAGLTIEKYSSLALNSRPCGLSRYRHMRHAPGHGVRFNKLQPFTYAPLPLTTTQVSFALVVAASVSLPAPVHVALLVSELAFAATAFSRYRCVRAPTWRGRAGALE